MLLRLHIEEQESRKSGYVTHSFSEKRELICEGQLLTGLLLIELWSFVLYWISLSFISTDIENSWAELWESNFELNPDLHLPAENKYIGQ